MSSTKFQDKRSILKNHLYSYTLAMDYSKRKIKKTTHLKWYQKEILRNRFNRKL